MSDAVSGAGSMKKKARSLGGMRRAAPFGTRGEPRGTRELAGEAGGVAGLLKNSRLNLKGRAVSKEEEVRQGREMRRDPYKGAFLLQLGVQGWGAHGPWEGGTGLELGILQRRGTSTFTTLFHHRHILEPFIWQGITHCPVTRSFLLSRSSTSPAFFVFALLLDYQLSAGTQQYLLSG